MSLAAPGFATFDWDRLSGSVDSNYNNLRTPLAYLNRIHVLVLPAAAGNAKPVSRPVGGAAGHMAGIAHLNA